MSMSALMCPHCGGRLLIDPTQRLQSMLTCPYCARKSLMQKKNGMIVLRGIISQSNPTPQEPSIAESSAPAEPADSHAPSESADSTIRPDTIDSLTPVETLTNAASVEPVTPVDSFEPAPIESVTPVDSFEPAPIESVVPVDSFEPAPIEQAAPVDSFEPAPIEPVAPVEPPAAWTPAEPAMPVVSFEPSRPIEEAAPEVSAELESAPDSVEMPVGRQKPRQDRLIVLASQAAASGQVMLFNSYARQAIDCDPTDPRAYALRARLIEEAHGFARSTFLSPVWMSQTPRQKAWTLAQHFASFNAAVAYSADPARSSLATEVGALIAWQIRESFLENARLRLGKRAFKGRFHRRDLSTAPRIIDACAHVNETVVPHVAGDLLRSVRLELEKLDSRLADQLQRIGF